MGKTIWAIESMTTGDIYGVFSTKGNAIEAIRMWSTQTHSYSIETNLDMIPRLNGKSDAITVRYNINRKTVTFWLKRLNLNNGACIIHAYRHNFGKADENKD